MLTGVRKGEELDITSSSGYLFGAACKPGMKVIVMQSVAGDSTVASVYTQDREGVIYILSLIYLLVLCLIGEAGDKGMSGTCFYILLCNLCIFASGVPEIFPLLDCCICMFYHYTGYDVSDRRTYAKNLCCNTWNPCWCYSCRGFRLVFQQGIRNFRIQCFGY